LFAKGPTGIVQYFSEDSALSTLCTARHQAMRCAPFLVLC
jgi:hypothetical protein